MNLLALLVLAATGPNVTATVEGGADVSGQLQRIDAEGIAIHHDGEDREIPLAELRRLSTDADPPSGGAVGVQLVDGSRVAASRVDAAEEGELTVHPVLGQPLRVALEDVAWIRFGQPSEEIDPQWREMIAEPSGRDALIIRRSGGALDQVRGVVLRIGEESIAFDLDGQQIDAPRERLEGVVFAAADGEAAGAAIAELGDQGGSLWRVASLAPVEDAEEPAVELVTAGGVRRRVELAEVASLVPEGNVVRLADLEPVVRDYTPRIGLPLPESLVRAQLGPRVLEDGSLRLASRSRVEYRVPEGFKHFVADGRIAPEVSAGASMRLRISVDGREEVDRVIAVDERPAEIRVDVSSGRRLAIELDYEDGGDLGDVYLLREARFIP